MRKVSKSSTLCFILLSSAAFAGAAKTDPKVGARKDPKEQRVESERGRSEALQSKRAELLTHLGASGFTEGDIKKLVQTAELEPAHGLSLKRLVILAGRPGHKGATPETRQLATAYLKFRLADIYDRPREVDAEDFDAAAPRGLGAGKWKSANQKLFASVLHRASTIAKTSKLGGTPKSLDQAFVQALRERGLLAAFRRGCKS